MWSLVKSKNAHCCFSWQVNCFVMSCANGRRFGVTCTKDRQPVCFTINWCTLELFIKHTYPPPPFIPTPSLHPPTFLDRSTAPAGGIPQQLHTDVQVPVLWAQGPHSPIFVTGGGGGFDRGSYFIPKNITTSEFVYPKKSLLFIVYPKKSLSPFFTTQKNPSVFLRDPKKIPASFHRPKKITFGQNFRPKTITRTPPPSLKYVSRGPGVVRVNMSIVLWQWKWTWHWDSDGVESNVTAVVVIVLR